MSLSGPRLFALTSLVMLAFAGNSLLCRTALRHTRIDAASFTLVRIATGALVLALLVQLARRPVVSAGSFSSAFALFAYAAGFSFAYLTLPAGTGALLLFGAVQATMILHGLWRGERLSARQGAGFALALGGIVVLVSPGISAPPLRGSALMIAAGVAWGAYSIRGRGSADPAAATAGNFIRATPMAVGLSLAMLPHATIDPRGVLYAALSGGITSGLGYLLWYTVLRSLKATTAAVVQLSVPVIAAALGVLFLNESTSLRLLLAGVATLGGIALVVLGKRAKNSGSA